MSASPRSRKPRRPRVSYSTPVRLSGEWSDREPWFVPLLAQSLDLSEGGMALVTPLHLQPGAAVTCSLRLGGRQTYFVGRVVWQRRAEDGTKRVGIQFVSPSDDDTSLMRRLLALGQSHPHRVNLRFDGRPDTMTALARVTRTGLALSAPLPILRRDTPVRFAFEGLGPTFHGRVEQVRLAHHHGMPALRVGIRVGDAARAHASEPAIESGPIVERADDTPVAVEVPVPADAHVAEMIEPARGAPIRRSSPFAPVPLALGVLALASGAFAHHLLQRSTDRVPAALVTAPVQSSAPPAPSPTAVALPETMVQPTAVAAGGSDDEVEPAQFEPTFKWRRDRRELFLPLRGSLAGMRQFAMSSPPGIAINAPNALGPRGGARVPVPHPGVTRIDLVRWRGGTRIRIWTDGVIAGYRVEPVAGGVRVVLPVAPEVEL